VIREMIEWFIGDVMDELGSRKEIEYAYRIMDEGASADRQLATYRRTGSLQAVVDQFDRRDRRRREKEKIMTRTILCLSSYFKGAAFLQASKEAGLHVILATNDRNKDEPWPRQYIDEFFHMPDLGKRPDIIHAVAYLARDRHFDLVTALDDFDVETAAHLREHFRLPGMGDSLARNFRDKLAMRTTARNVGLLVPEFTGVFNYDKLREFMGRVPPPWLLKPRSEASSMGIKKIHHADELWPILESLGDQQSFFVMEQFVAGDVFHVEGWSTTARCCFRWPINTVSRPSRCTRAEGCSSPARWTASRRRPGRWLN
jgi:hypothetical protein